MKKTAIAIAVALTGFAALTQAAPLPNTWYTGGKLGWSHYYHTGTPDLTQNDGPTRKDDLGLGAFAGYQANPYLAFELGYDWLGRMAYKGDNNNGAFKSQGVQLTGKLSYPIVNNLDIYTRLGGMIWRADSSFSDNVDRKSGSDTGVSPLAAIGLEYALSQNWATRLDYQWVHKIGDRSDTYARPDNTLLSAGLSYRFGQNAPAAVLPVAAVAAAAVAAPETVQPEHFNLQSDVLFGFNKSSLKDSGKQTLDQLYSKLSTINPASGSTTIIGYTDHIGSNNYNQKLSQQRAQSVMNYLISKGIPADSISARGLGESNSVTGSKCNGIKNKAKLISCLSPDRRVEIEVKGLKQQ